MNMKKTILLSLAFGALLVSSCTSVNRSMREPMTTVRLERADFDLSSQVTASAQATYIFGLDFSRLFKKESGGVDKDEISMSIGYGSSFSIPVIGNFVVDPTASYALFNLMSENEGYDVVFYPQYNTRTVMPIGIPIFKTTTVEVTARLGKFK